MSQTLASLPLIGVILILATPERTRVGDLVAGQGLS